jgi:hypothetical protein
MNKPTLTKVNGLYRLEYPGEDITIEVDRISEHGDETRGQLTVLSTSNSLVVSQFNHNFGSLAAREKAAKHLAGSLDIEWKPILEMASYEILKDLRQGEPVKMVGNQPMGERPKYLSHPLLLARQPNLIYGTWGTAKTTIAIKTALEAGVNTLHLDYEWFDDEVNDLIRRLKDGMGLDPDLEIAYRFCSLPLADDIAAIQKMGLETQAELVIVDSVGAACGGDPMDPGVVLRYFSALRSLRVTTLSLDHVAKEARGPFGSVYKMNSARNAWEVVGGTRDDNTLTIGLHHRKVNSGPLLKPIGYQFTYTPGSIIPKKIDVRTIPEILAGMGLADQIEAALLRGALTAAELAEELGTTPGTVSVTLSRHKERFVSTGGGKWGNKAKEPTYEDNQE